MQTKQIIDTILGYYPDTQAIYLFGSYGTEYERPDSDIDLGLLLPALHAKNEGSLTLKDCWHALTSLLNRSVDLVNLRMVNTVFQFQILQTGHLIFENDTYAIHEFEMLTLSYYQKLHEERAGILAEIISSKMVIAL